MFKKLAPIFYVQYLHHEFRLLKLKIKAREDIPEFLTAKPSVITFFSVGYRLELNFFLFAQLNLKFGTDLGDQVLDGWSVTQ